MKRVVVIDDSEVVIELVRSALEEEGYLVTALLEPDRAQIEAGPPPDLLLVDINMPQVFGDDVAQFVRDAWGIEAPIYLFSDIAEDELRERAAAAEVAGYMWKGWGIERVIDELCDLLGPAEAP